MTNRTHLKTLVVIAGPTAIGKTAIAIQLAQKLNTAILSADSRQFYKEMVIGTAKPTLKELAAAEHYFIDSHSISASPTAADFEKEALHLLNELFKTKDVVILVGGSGLFIKAVCEGFDDIPSAAPEFRENLNQQLQDKGIAYLQERLKIADPTYCEQADINNPQRVIRALEIYESTGHPFSSFRTLKINKRPFTIIKIGLNMPRAALYERINKRVDDMIMQGLVDEVRSLIDYRHLNALNTVGYTEIFEYIDGKLTLEAAIESIKQNTRRFAKRQLTWFRKDREINWFEANALLSTKLENFLFDQLQ